MKTNFLKLNPIPFLIFLTLIIFSATYIPAAPGDLDATFGNGGVVDTNFESLAEDLATDIAVQADGKILIVGFAHYSQIPASRIIIARYNTNGSLDSTFGEGGKVITSFGFSNRASGIAIQADGRIVVSGYTVSGFSSVDFLAARFETNGTLDASFDGDGVVIIDMGGSDGASDLTLQPDGKIVIGGGSSPDRFAVARLNSNGSLDSSFDGDGRVTTALGVSGSGASGVELQQDGKIIAAGNRSSGINTDFALVRYNANGTLDTTFSGDGIAITPISNSSDYAIDVAVQADGKIVAIGSVDNIAVGVIRYNSIDGSLDTSFDDDGIEITPIPFLDYSVYPSSVAIQSNGKIIIAGSGEDSNMNTPGFLVRYDSNGSLDTTFGFEGVASSGINNLLSSLAIQPDGKIVAAGDNYVDVIVARFMGDAVARNRQLFDFDGDGRTDVGVYRPSNGQWWYIRSSDSQSAAAQFSISDDLPVPGDYTGDGKADIAHFRPSTGEWFILRSENGSYYSYQFGLTGDIPAPADYDGDGITDTATFRPSTATWYIFNSGSGTYGILTFGLDGDKPVPADYDGDGKADIAVWRPSNGTWWIVRSADLQQRGYGFGFGTDKPVVGDYTGDGKADIAVWRPGTSEWFFLRSEDGSYYSLPFGLPGDIPAPGDYDGDGRFDTAVFRPSETNWYVQRSSAGIMIRQFGLADDTPVPAAYLP